jgi:hypothetical protein
MLFKVFGGVQWVACGIAIFGTTSRDVNPVLPEAFRAAPGVVLIASTFLLLGCLAFSELIGVLLSIEEHAATIAERTPDDTD